ncbi:aminotransferase-like protein [Scheffersomyces xylosifermentans]|uniref:aminotransferase-like protein n=1 Tax=Scheffersomyces xylosifermentans TaxID=1304137 RepID=UPI00315D6509
MTKKEKDSDSNEFNDSEYDSVIERIQKNYIKQSFPEVDSKNFEILSTIRYDPTLTTIPPTNYDEIKKSNFFLFEEHLKRNEFTLRYFQLQFNDDSELDFELSEEFFLNHLIQALRLSEKLVTESYKVRCLIHLDGKVDVEIHNTPARENLLEAVLKPSISSERDDLPDFAENKKWDVYLDKEVTMISPFTSFKTTNRKHYSDSRARSLPGRRPGMEEVLLYNSQKNLMEGSITNVAIRRKGDGKWVTPQLSAGCLCGVMRHFLLRRNYIEEQTISMKDVPVGTEVLLFNAIMGVVEGKVIG